MLRELVQRYVEAKRHHDEATKLFHRAERTAWKHLAKRMGDERAYELAGIALADERMIRAYIAKQDAMIALVSATLGCDAYTKVMVGAQLTYIDAEPLKAANDL